MKYHQLVPVRAINALSDWLVYNLEELGVEDSLVYSRLLLSLLHTTVHVSNIEQAADIPYFKEFVTLNKSYQVSQLDTEELKRFAAVNLLIEATSNNSSALEKDNSTIIELVNELHRKYYDIERESAVATASSGSEDVVVLAQGQGGIGGDTNPISKRADLDTAAATAAATPLVTPGGGNAPAPLAPRSIEDRTNMYYNAFPALMNIELPVPSGGGGAGSGAQPRMTTTATTKWQATTTAEETRDGMVTWSNIFNANKASAAVNITSKVASSGIVNGMKKKPKRKRSGTSGKPKSLYGKKQTSVDGSLWDMDFQGAWEMGQDDVFKIESLRRNRSVSEGEVYNLGSDDQYDAGKHNNNNIINNNFEHVVSFYQQGPTEHQLELLKAQIKKFNNVTLGGSGSSGGVGGGRDDQVAQMEEKFEKIRTLWNDEKDESGNEFEGMYAVMPAASDDVRRGNVWEPLQPPLDDYNENAIIDDMTVFRPLRSSTPKSSPSPIGTPSRAVEMKKNHAGDYLQILPQNPVWANTVEADEDGWGNARNIFNNYALPTQQAPPMQPIPSVSLRNHSEKSHFKRVVPTFPPTQRQLPLQPVEIRSPISEVASEENLLLSQSTHFSPIKKRRYPDGYAFPTNDSMLKVDFYRSESCSLYAGNEKYMEVEWEYKPEDFETDDDPLPHLVPVLSDGGGGSGGVEKDTFTVKVLLNTQNDKACQTDKTDMEDVDIVEDTRRMEFAHNWRYNEYILQDTKIDYVDQPETKTDDKKSDPWTKGGHFCLKNNNAYSVWQKCEGCDDTQPIPANPQLKEELYAEGEDILFQLWSLNIEKSDWDEDDDECADVYGGNYGYGSYGSGGTGVGCGATDMGDCSSSPLDHYNNEYHRVDNFVSELLKPETTQNLAKALAQTERFLPFEYFVNCSSGTGGGGSVGSGGGGIGTAATGKKRKSNGELVLGCYPMLPQTPPPQVEISLTEGLMNLCNYIDTTRGGVVRLPYEAGRGVGGGDRKRRHSACKNQGDHELHTTDFDYDYGGTLKITTNNKNKEIVINTKPYILRNDIFLTQIDDISRPLTR